jgi:hypothetical protein
MTDAIIPGDGRLPGGPGDPGDDATMPGAHAAEQAEQAPDVAGYEAIQDDDARRGENYYEEMTDTTGPFIEGGDDVDTGAGRSRPRD